MKTLITLTLIALFTISFKDRIDRPIQTLNLKNQEQLDIGSITTVIGVIKSGYDLYKTIRKDRADLSKSELNLKKITGYYNNIDKKLRTLIENDIAINRAVNANTELLKIIIRDLDRFGISNTQSDINILQGIVSTIAEKTSKNDAKNEFNSQEAVYHGKLLNLLNNGHGLDYVFSLPKFIDFYFYHLNPRNLDQNFTSRKKSEILEQLDWKIAQLKLLSDKYDAVLQRRINAINQLVGQGNKIGYISDETMERVRSITNINELYTRGVKRNNPTNDDQREIDSKIKTQFSHFPSEIEQYEYVVSVTGGLMLYRNQLD